MANFHMEAKPPNIPPYTSFSFQSVQNTYASSTSFPKTISRPTKSILFLLSSSGAFEAAFFHSFMGITASVGRDRPDEIVLVSQVPMLLAFPTTD